MLSWRAISKQIQRFSISNVVSSRSYFQSSLLRRVACFSGQLLKLLLTLSFASRWHTNVSSNFAHASHTFNQSASARCSSYCYLYSSFVHHITIGPEPTTLAIVAS